MSRIHSLRWFGEKMDNLGLPVSRVPSSPLAIARAPWFVSTAMGLVLNLLCVAGPRPVAADESGHFRSPPLDLPQAQTLTVDEARERLADRARIMRDRQEDMERDRKASILSRPHEHSFGKHRQRRLVRANDVVERQSGNRGR